MNQLIGLILCMVVASPTFAERKTYTVMGGATCKAWSESRQKATRGEGVDRLSDVHETAWVLGFLSSLNATLGGDKDVLGAVDAETIKDWMDKYCGENPSKRTDDGAIILFAKLMKLIK